MTLGAAIFASVVLVLLVYNEPFRKKFTRIAGALAAVALVVGLVWYTYVKYQDQIQVKQAAAHKKLVDACIERFSKSDYKKSDEWADYLDVPASCENDPNQQWSATHFSADTPYSPVIEIHGGETLKFAQPKPSNTSDLHVVRSAPLIYIGQGQEFKFVCGNFGERGYEPSFKRGEVSCPWVDYKETQKP